MSADGTTRPSDMSVAKSARRPKAAMASARRYGRVVPLAAPSTNCAALGSASDQRAIERFDPHYCRIGGRRPASPQCPNPVWQGQGQHPRRLSGADPVERRPGRCRRIFAPMQSFGEALQQGARASLRTHSWKAPSRAVPRLISSSPSETASGMSRRSRAKPDHKATNLRIRIGRFTPRYDAATPWNSWCSRDP